MLIIMVPVLINKDVFESSYNDSVGTKVIVVLDCEF